jgi:hypothetical protein
MADNTCTILYGEIMMSAIKGMVLFLALNAGAAAWAGSVDGRAVVGGAMGGAAGAAVGSAVGGRNGAIIGAGVGGAAGAAVATTGKSKPQPTAVQKEVVVVHEVDDRHDNGRHKGWYKHKRKHHHDRHYDNDERDHHGHGHEHH